MQNQIQIWPKIV